jgi:hypothetical protein
MAPALFLILVVVLTIITSLGCAIWFCDHGLPFPWAVGGGACCGVFLVTQGIAIAFAVRRVIWRRTRRYPFAEGDLVEITRGIDCGRRGQVCGHDQGIWHFQIRLTSDDGQAKNCWISASRLKRTKG